MDRGAIVPIARPLPMDGTTADSFGGTISVNESSRTDMSWIGIGSPITLSIILLYLRIIVLSQEWVSYRKFDVPTATA